MKIINIAALFISVIALFYIQPGYANEKINDQIKIKLKKNNWLLAKNILPDENIDIVKIVSQDGRPLVDKEDAEGKLEPDEYIVFSLKQNKDYDTITVHYVTESGLENSIEIVNGAAYTIFGIAATTFTLLATSISTYLVYKNYCSNDAKKTNEDEEEEEEGGDDKGDDGDDKKNDNDDDDGDDDEKKEEDNDDNDGDDDDDGKRQKTPKNKKPSERQVLNKKIKEISKKIKQLVEKLFSEINTLDLPDKSDFDKLSQAMDDIMANNQLAQETIQELIKDYTTSQLSAALKRLGKETLGTIDLSFFISLSIHNALQEHLEKLKNEKKQKKQKKQKKRKEKKRKKDLKKKEDLEKKLEEEGLTLADTINTTVEIIILTVNTRENSDRTPIQTYVENSTILTRIADSDLQTELERLENIRDNTLLDDELENFDGELQREILDIIISFIKKKVLSKKLEGWLPIEKTINTLVELLLAEITLNPNLHNNNTFSFSEIDNFVMDYQQVQERINTYNTEQLSEEINRLLNNTIERNMLRVVTESALIRAMQARIERLEEEEREGEEEEEKEGNVDTLNEEDEALLNILMEEAKKKEEEEEGEKQAEDNENTIQQVNQNNTDTTEQLNNAQIDSGLNPNFGSGTFSNK